MSSGLPVSDKNYSVAQQLLRSDVGTPIRLVWYAASESRSGVAEGEDVVGAVKCVEAWYGTRRTKWLGSVMLVESENVHITVTNPGLKDRTYFALSTKRVYGCMHRWSGSSGTGVRLNRLGIDSALLTAKM